MYQNPDEIQKLEMEIYQLTKKLEQLRAGEHGSEVKNYRLNTLNGETTLMELFGQKDKLIVIHNMGQACRYCTLWADGFNGFLPHLENATAIALVSKDDPETQRTFANSRGWRFRMASHGGGEYIREQGITKTEENEPGIVCYEKKNGKIYRKNASVFGPGDQFCSLWSVLSLAGLNEDNWFPQYNYWKRPEQMDDGGKNLA